MRKLAIGKGRDYVPEHIFGDNTKVKLMHGDDQLDKGMRWVGGDKDS